MRDVEDTMRCQRKELRASHSLQDECMGGISHHREERIVRGNYDRHDRIEGAAAIHAEAGGKEPH
jgi:hypothetical protein